jgi:hypothetical protein
MKNRFLGEAEGEGFEPSIRLTTDSDFRDRRIGRRRASLDEDALALQARSRRSYDEVLQWQCNSGFTAGSSPSVSAVLSKLQGFSTAAIITRNEGVRGSNPRVGFPNLQALLVAGNRRPALRANTLRTRDT